MIAAETRRDTTPAPPARTTSVVKRGKLLPLGSNGDLPNLSTIALEIAGDFAGLTWYTKPSGTKVAYPISPPDKPPSESQLMCCARFKAAMASWRTLDKRTKNLYREVCDLLHLCMLGHNLWVHFAITQDQKTYLTYRLTSRLDFPFPILTSH